MPEGSDFWDYCWLQMIKLKAGKLYEFTENYLQEVGALSNTMDDALLKSDQSAHGFNNLWSTAVKLIKRSKSSSFENLARDGKALSWLAEVVREQGFAHGKPESIRAEKERQWLTAEQLDKAVSILIKRFKAIKYSEFVSSASPIDMLYLWYQLGNGDELVKYIALNTKSGEAFLATLRALRGYSVSGRGVTHPLSAETAKRFFGDKDIKTRLEKIANAKNDGHSAQAKDILAVWREQD